MISLPIIKYGLTFRLVETYDAAFILSLRSNLKLSKHLSPTSNNLENQISWIESYKKREKKEEEYYFIYESLAKESIGVVRLYELSGKKFNCGSWLVKPGIDDFAAIKADLFINEFAFNTLSLEECHFDVRKDNKKVLRYHKMFAKPIAEDDLNIYFLADKNDFERKKTYLISILDEN